MRQEDSVPGARPSARVRVRVIGSLRPGWLRIVIGPGQGMLDGGVETDWPAERVPEDARKPNGEFWISPDELTRAAAGPGGA